MAAPTLGPAHTTELDTIATPPPNSTRHLVGCSRETVFVDGRRVDTLPIHADRRIVRSIFACRVTLYLAVVACTVGWPLAARAQTAAIAVQWPLSAWASSTPSAPVEASAAPPPVVEHAPVVVPKPDPAPVSTGHFLKPPVFLFQPGAFVSNLVNAPAGTDAHAELNLRFLTLIPTGFSHIVLVSGVGFTPLAADGGNAPVFFYGLVIPFNVSSWMTVAPVLFGGYAPGFGGTTTPGRYGHDLLAELGVLLHVGPKLFPKAPGPLGGMSIYALADQKITHRGDFSPAFLFGLSLPLAP